MSKMDLPQDAGANRPTVRLLDELCDEFESAWLNGLRPRIEDFVERVAEDRRLKLFRELLALELDYLADRGQWPSNKAYASRFPQWAQTIDEVFAGVVAQQGDAQFNTPAGRAGDGTLPLPPHKLANRPLPVVPGFELLRVLGRGAMGVVYEARQTKLGRRVALKMVLAGGHAGPEALARFHSEAEAVARLQHPHIVQVFEVGEHEGLPYLALEFVEGGNLAQQLAGAPRSVREAAATVETLARAIDYAHSQGVVHRDLKPANILLQKSDHGSQNSSGSGRASPSAAATLDGWMPKIADFGLAKQIDSGAARTKSGDVLGTPGYMAPEQAAGRVNEVGPVSDVYALGAILYEMLTGRPPFKAENAWATIEQVIANPPVAPKQLQSTVPKDLETICLKCLEKETRKRYASAGQLADDLRRYLAGLPIHARAIGSWGRAVKWARRRPAAAALAATLLLAGLSAVAGLVLHNIGLREANQRIIQQRDRARDAEHQALDEKNRAEANHRYARNAVDECFRLVTQEQAFLKEGMDEANAVLAQVALKYYLQLLEVSGGSEATQANLALAHYRAGTLQSRIGEKRGALSHLTAARDILEEFRAEHTEIFTPDAAQTLSECHQRIAQMQLDLGEPVAQAIESFERGTQAGELFAERWPDEFEVQSALIHCRHQQALLFQRTGNPDQALAIHRLNQALLAELAGKHPQWDLRYDLGTSMATIGGIERSAGRIDEARRSLKEARDLLADLVHDAPSPRHRAQLGAASYQAAMLELDQGKLNEAIEPLEQAEAIYAALLQANPRVKEYKHSLARCRLSLGIVEQARGNRQAAGRLYAQAAHALEELRSEEVADVSVLDDLSKAHNQTAIWMVLTGNLAGASESHLKGAAILKELVRQQPDVTEYRRNLAVAYMNLGSNERKLGRLDKAVESYEQAREIRVRLAEEHPDAPQFQRDLAALLINMAGLFRDLNDSEKALAAYRDASERLGPLVERNPGVIDFRFLQAVAHLERGTALAALSRWDDAIDEYRKASAVFETLVRDSPRDTEFKRAQMNCLFMKAVAELNRPDLEAGGQSLSHARQVAEEILAGDEQNHAVQSALGQIWAATGDMVWNQGKREEAVSAAERAIESHTAAVRLAPTVVEYRHWLGRAYDHLCLFYRNLGLLDKAAVAAIQRADLAAGNFEELYQAAVELARCYKQAALLSEPSDDSQRSQQERYGRAALETLGKAIDGGFRDAGRLTADAELAPLVTLDGYAQLIERLKQLAAEPNRK